MFPKFFRVALPSLLATGMLAGGCPSETHLESAMMMQSEDDKSKTPRYSDSGHDLTPPSSEEKAKLVAKLTPEQKRITQKAGTEAAFCGTLLDNKKDGFYACVVCGLPLFKSDDKFTSGTGWPSFTYPYDRQHVVGRRDNTHGMSRTEILCARCDAHLGHVFEDGPEPSGLRFCLNSEALSFHNEGDEIPAESQTTEDGEVAYFAGGCFWGIEYAFGELPGVYSATSGYQNGATENPEYRQVCEGTTGHAESVRVRFDPDTIDYETLVRFFFEIHDPTTMNRQGPDVGTQYRSGIYTASPEQKKIVEKVIAELSEEDAFDGKKIVTQVEEAKEFYPAETYHQDYVNRTGRACHPGIGAAVEEYKERLSRESAGS